MLTERRRQWYWRRTLVYKPGAPRKPGWRTRACYIEMRTTSTTRGAYSPPPRREGVNVLQNVDLRYRVFATFDRHLLPGSSPVSALE